MKSQSGVLKVTKTIVWIHSMYFDLEMRHRYIAIASNDCSLEMFPSIMKWSEGNIHSYTFRA